MRYIGLDLGTKTLGVAVSDKLGIIASFYKTYFFKDEDYSSLVPIVKELMTEFENEKQVFDEVSSATLVHWDMWEGNVFVEDDHVSGIIDWERAMWGEALMDDRFRKHNLNKDFLDGFCHGIGNRFLLVFTFYRVKRD